MPVFKQYIMDSISDEGVYVLRLTRDTAGWWNRRRLADDTRVFCGWYWIRPGTPGDGPFATKSAAYRDAYYRFVLKRKPPSAIEEAERVNHNVFKFTKTRRGKTAKRRRA